MCAMFPVLGDRDRSFIELAGSVEIHGLIDPIVIDHEGRILDGRHRLRACAMAGIPPQFVNFSDLNFQGTEGDFAFARNLCRRDLTDDQRAALVVEYDEYTRTKDSQWKREMTKEKPREPTGSFQPTGKKPVRQREKLQKTANVSQHKARQAMDVAKHAPELLPAVKAGEKKLKEAHKTAVARKPRTAKPRQFDFEGFVDRVDAGLKKLFAKCPAEWHPKLKQRVVSLVNDL